MMKKFFLTFVCIFVSSVFVFAQQNAPSLLTPEQTMDMRRLQDAQISPDGERIAFTVSDRVPDVGRTTDIWVCNVKTKDVRRFTTSPKRDYTPRWSPDGRTIAFISDREGKPQIFLIGIDGGEAVSLTKSESGVQSFEWSPDGKRIAFLAEELPTADEAKKEQTKDDARVVDKDDKLTRIWLIDVASKKSRQLTSDRWRVDEIKWMPTSDKLIVSATNKPETDANTSRIYSINTNEGADKTLLEIAAPVGPFGDIKVSPDGKSLAYLGVRLDGPSPHDIFLQNISGGAPRNLTAESVDRQLLDFTWRKDGSMLASFEFGFKTFLYQISPDGKAKKFIELENNPVSFSIAGDSDAMSFIGQTTTDAPELYFVNAQNNVERVTNINENFSKLSLIKPEFLRYKSFDGIEIEASLLKPRNYAAGTKIPLVVLVHGGPTGRWDDSMQSWGQLLAARGYAVLYPNVRGSTGYGWKFLTSNRADWGGGDFKDVMAGVDELVKRGIADENRLGIAGWSYGGYMSEWAITQTTRFKAAVSGAGLSDLASEFGTEDSPIYDEWFYGTPYEKPQGFAKSSPITFIKNAKTPTLILQGENDVTDPIGQSQQLYRGLKRYGVESDFVLYPREGHGIREDKHIIDVSKRIIAWFDKYIKP